MRLSRDQIRELCEGEITMISPFVGEKVALRSMPSYGLCESSYDIRLSSVFKRPAKPKGNIAIFPDNTKTEDVSHRTFMIKENDRTTYFYPLEPKEFVLGLSVETFNIPTDVTALCVVKSKLARLGVMNVDTPLQPGWNGRLVIELFNAGTETIALPCGHGILSIAFDRLGSHSAYDGYYQDQESLVL